MKQYRDDNEYPEMSGFQPYHLEEPEVIARLIDMINRPGKSSDIGVFGDGIYRRFDMEDYMTYKGFYIGQCLTRQELGLPGEGQKPGDIDILIIPYKEDEILYERAAAYEVKVIRPTRQNMKKRPNSFGVKQINGYIQDGFPFVSALHICMTEPLHENELVHIPFSMRPANEEEPVPDDAPPLEAYEMVGRDWLPWFATDNHMRRMIASGIPKFVGLRIESWNLAADGHLVTSRSLEFRDFEGCFWNPHRKKETVELIARHLTQHPERYKDVPIVRVPGKWERKEEIYEGMDNIQPDASEKENEAVDEAPVSIYSFFEPNTFLNVPPSAYPDASLCFPVTGHGMDDGTEKSIKDGAIIVVKDLGLPSFENIPCFQPVVIMHLKSGKPFNLVGIITKKHEAGKTFRLSFYNIKHPETWIKYSTVKQVFEVVDSLEGDLVTIFD